MEKPDFRDYPNSPEGLAAYDAALEKFERVQKGPMIGTKFADTVEDVVQSAGEQISKIPGVNIVLQHLGGGVRTIDQVMSQDQGPGGMIYRTYQNVRSAAETGFSDLAESAGVDPRIGAFAGGELVDTLATAGLGSVARKTAAVVDTLPPGGMSPQLATAGGSQIDFSKATATFQPPTVNQITVTKPELIAPGVKQGVAKTDNYKFGIAKLRAQGAADAKRVEDYMTQFASGEITKDQLTERLAKVKKRGDAKYSTLATLDDPDIFEKPRFQNVDPTNPAVKADQHHAATKAMTTPWVRKALEIGDDDDIVALFELHRMLTGSGMGNVRSGIIDIPGVVHDTAKATRAGRDPSQAIHSFMKKKGAGIEIRTDAVEKIVGDPKNMDELLDKYVTFANEYLIPQKELSLKALDKELTRHRSTLSGSELEQFDKLVSKLNRANT